jgi:hypothetical protein
VNDLQALRRECATRRGLYLHARLVYGEAMRFGTVDTGALRAELGDALMAYYAAHSALHGAIRRRELAPQGPLRSALH